MSERPLPQHSCFEGSRYGIRSLRSDCNGIFLVMTICCKDKLEGKTAVFKIANVCRGVWTDLAADFLACQVLVLQVALADMLLGRHHHSRHSHSKLLQHMLCSYHLCICRVLSLMPLEVTAATRKVPLFTLPAMLC